MQIHIQVKGKGNIHHPRINGNVVTMLTKAAFNWLDKEDEKWWKEPRRKYEHPVGRMTDRSSVQLPQVPFCPHSLTAPVRHRGSVSAAKDTVVSAACLGSIVHQAASVMGSSLWQWSSGHKSKRAHKHNMTDGREDKFGQGGRDEKRELKWDRRRGTAADRVISARIVMSLGKVLSTGWFMEVRVQCQRRMKGEETKVRKTAGEFLSNRCPKKQKSWEG